MVGTYKPGYDSTFISILCLDNNCNALWSQTHFSSAISTYPSNIVKSNTEGYLIIGYKGNYPSTDGTILKINDSGELIWRKSYGGPSSEYFNDILILESNEFLVVGSTDSFGAGKEDAWVLKFTADTTTTDVKNDYNSKSPESYTLNQNYPNPFNPITKISWQAPVGSWQTLKVYDVLGNEVATLVDEYKTAGKYEIEFNSHSGKGPNLTSGVYFYQLLVSSLQSKDGKNANYIETKKMILMK
jgi:hypothetical protein